MSVSNKHLLITMIGMDITIIFFLSLQAHTTSKEQNHSR